MIKAMIINPQGCVMGKKQDSLLEALVWLRDMLVKRSVINPNMVGWAGRVVRDDQTVWQYEGGQLPHAVHMAEAVKMEAW